MTKDEIRELVKSQRKKLANTDIQTKSRIISDAVFALPCYRASKTVMTYISSFKEPSMNDIMRDVLTSKKLVVPISNTDNFTITPSYLTSMADLKKGAYGILEPQTIIPASVNDIDVALIPGIAFDKSGARTGFGKGYYDRFLSEFKGIKIGICYDFQLFERIPSENHDIRMDIIITEKRIYNDF